MRCLFFSGGLMSWAAAKRAVAKYGVENSTLLFTDTLIEDADLYRFLDEAADNVGAPLVKISDGRTPWQVFNDEGMIGNTMADPCSRILKRELSLKWLQENCDPNNTVLIFGIHIEEDHRLEHEAIDKKTGEKVFRGVRPRYQALGWPHVEATMCDSPWMTSRQIRDWATSEGLALPRLYALGFSHNNCGGFCVKAGEGHFAHLLRALPEVYAANEAREEEFNRNRPGQRRQTVLAPERMIDGRRTRVPMSLREFRENIESQGQVHLFDMNDIGGCGCFLDDPSELES
jgi:3'-phosphoadenosine 5'-phosphosulfate sulfotransferase (PAPS reductase)/FAD synthetase